MAPASAGTNGRCPRRRASPGTRCRTSSRRNRRPRHIRDRCSTHCRDLFTVGLDHVTTTEMEFASQRAIVGSSLGKALKQWPHCSSRLPRTPCIPATVSICGTTLPAEPTLSTSAPQRRRPNSRAPSGRRGSRKRPSRSMRIPRWMSGARRARSSGPRQIACSSACNSTMPAALASWGGRRRLPRVSSPSSRRTGRSGLSTRRDRARWCSTSIGSSSRAGSAPSVG